MVETNLPLILLKSNILFPYNELRVEVVHTQDKLVLENALKYHDGQVLLVNLEDEEGNIKRYYPNEYLRNLQIE